MPRRNPNGVDGDLSVKLDGTLSEEESIIKSSFEEYCRKNITPIYDRLTEKREFPKNLMRELAGIVLGATTPVDPSEKLDEVMLGILSESMGKFEVPVPAFLTMHFSKLLPLVRDEEERVRYLKKYRTGDLVICGAFTEPGQGSDSASVSTTAVRNGSGYTLNGEKSFVSSPGIANAHIISARTGNSPWEERHKGISLFISDSGTNGLEPYEMENMASIFRGDFGGLRLDNVSLPEGHMIGEENKGFQVLMKILSIQRVHVGLYTIGLAESALEEAIEYAKVRKTFGQSISKYEAVSFRLAEDWSKLEAVRMLAYKALSMQDHGLDNTAESAAVKGYGCEAAFQATSDALQTMGAAGYVKSSGMERKFRSSRGFLIGDGTPDIQRLILSRKIFGRKYAP